MQTPFENFDIRLIEDAKNCFVGSVSQKEKDRKFDEYNAQLKTNKEKVRFSLIYAIVEKLIDDLKELSSHGCFKDDRAAHDYLSKLYPKNDPTQIKILCFNAIKPYLQSLLSKTTVELINMAQDIIANTKNNISLRNKMRMSKKETDLNPNDAVLFDNINFLLDYFINNTDKYENTNEEEIFSCLKETTIPAEISNELIKDCFIAVKNSAGKPSKPPSITQNIKNNFWNTNSRAQFERVCREVLYYATDEIKREKGKERRDYVMSKNAFKTDALEPYIEPNASFTQAQKEAMKRNRREREEQYQRQTTYSESERAFYQNAMPLYDAITSIYNYVFKDRATLEKIYQSLSNLSDESNKSKILEIFKEGGITLNVSGYESDDLLLECLKFASKEINLHANTKPSSGNESEASMRAKTYYYGLDR